MSFTTIVFILFALAHIHDEVHGQPISETRVIGGHNASRGEYPHLVSLQHVGNDFAHHTCGGTILNELWVLTAAHCYLGRIATGVNVVVAGRHNLYELENTEQVVRIKYIIVHNKFDILRGLQYDVALLKLKTPLKFNDAVKPIGIPEPGSVPEGVTTLAGWGLTHHSPNERPAVLQTTEVPLIDVKTCQKAVSGISPKLIVFDTNICTGPLTGGHAACDGDSGGPLIQTNANGKVQVIGISSWTLKPCGMIGSPTVYTRVSAYVDWIRQTIMSN